MVTDDETPRTGLKEFAWVGSSKTDLSAGISGVYEIRLSSEGSIFRTAYVTKLGDRIVVLHCWQKKTRATARADKDLIVARYREAKEKLA